MAVRYLAAGLPCGLVMDEATGRVHGSARDTVAAANVTVIAQAGGRSATVNDAAFTLTVDDCNANISCNGNGVCADDVPFDGDFRCVCNPGWTGTRCTARNATVGQPAAAQQSTVVIGISAGAGALVLLLVVAVVTLRVRAVRRRNRPLSFDEKLQQLRAHGLVPEEDSISASRAARPREIRRQCVQLMEKLGEGAFGEVWKGYLDELVRRGTPGFQVAVKTIKDPGDGAAIDDFMGEAALMAGLKHRNVLSLIGVVTRGSPKLMVVPICGNGDLRGFLRRMTGALNVKLQLRICNDVALGMNYLAGRRCVTGGSGAEWGGEKEGLCVGGREGGRGYL